VIAGRKAPDIELQSMFPFGQSARKYFQPPHILLILLLALAHEVRSVVSTPFGLRQ
jgi:hypothetical protein